MALHTASSHPEEQAQRETKTCGPPPPGQACSYLQGPRELDCGLSPVSDLLSVVVAVRNKHAANVPQLRVENFKAPMERRRWSAHVSSGGAWRAHMLQSSTVGNVESSAIES